MSLRDNLKPYTIEAIQRLGGRGRLWQIRYETIKILDREGKLGYVSRTGPRLYQQRWTLELLKEEGILDIINQTNIINIILLFNINTHNN